MKVERLHSAESIGGKFGDKDGKLPIKAQALGRSKVGSCIHTACMHTACIPRALMEDIGFVNLCN